jgi:RNA polymerase sigma factor (sigma-70 family)
MKKSPRETNTPENQEAAFERRMSLVEGAVDKYHNYLKGYLFDKTRNIQDAENLLQDLWQHVLLNFNEDLIGQLPILRRKALQLFIDFYRKKARSIEHLIEDPDLVPTRSMRPEAYTEEEELDLKERFWSEFPGVSLGDEQKEVLWLYARYGFTYTEISEQLGVPSSTVGDWIGQGRRCFAEYLNRK